MKLTTKQRMAATAASAALALTLPLATFASGYTPANRATFQCITPSDCPGAGYVTFDSITNAPNYGDERDFLNVRDANSSTWLNTMTVSNGEELVVRMYVHNDANPNAIGFDAATAHNTELSVLLPGTSGTSMDAAGNISASNANPGTIGDTITLNGAQPFTVSFDQSSPVQVTYRPNGTGNFVTRNLPGASFVRDNVMEANVGDWHGCFPYSALVTMKVKVNMPSTPSTPVTPQTPATPAQPTTTALPQTGAETAGLAGIGGTGAIGYGVMAYRRSKKALADKLLHRQ